MRRIAGVISVTAVVLMITGFAISFFLHPLPRVPGAPALPASAVWRFQVNDWGMWAMSAGILLLALLPMARVLLAIWMFLRSRDLLDTVVALVVLVELLISMRVG